MGALDKRTVGGGSALFEVTLSVNPRVLLEYLTGRNGLRRHLSYSVLTLVWMTLGCVMQLSLSAVFPELPLYPLPLTVAYLALHRPPYWALLCSFACGVIVDALWFCPLGVTSAVLAAVVILVLFFRICIQGLERHFFQGCVMGGGCAVFLYVAAKLLLYFATAHDSGFMDLMPRHLLLGPLLNALCLAPLLYAVMDSVEWLLGLRPSGGNAGNATDEG